VSAFIGIIGAVIAGVFNGSYGVVMKVTKKWEWENIWLLFSVPALVVFPWIFAVWSVPGLFDVYSKVPGGVLARTFLLGAGWGMGSVFFGLGMYLLGVSLGYTIMMGIIAAAGALIPMLVTNPASVFKTGGLVIIMAMLVSIAGVVFCGMAGAIRDKSLQEQQTQANRPKFKSGFLVCMVAAVLSSMLNLAFHFGAPIAETAKANLAGAAIAFRANNAIWSLALLGGFIPNFLYCGFLVLRKGTWKKYSQAGTGSYWFWGIVMGGIFTGSLMIYGAAASAMGKMGTTVGWLVFITAGILMGNLWGIFTGEWKQAPKKAHIRMLQGCLLLVCSVILVSIGNYLLG